MPMSRNFTNKSKIIRIILKTSQICQKYVSNESEIKFGILKIDPLANICLQTLT